MFCQLAFSILFVCLTQANCDAVFDEDIDIDSIIGNDRILDTYLKCFYNTGSCSTRAERVKVKIREVISTVCGDCSLKQRQMLHHVLRLFVPKRPDDWKKILEIYDPESEYAAQMNAFIKGPAPQI